MITVQVRTDGRIPRRDLDAARRAMAHLDRYVDRPLLSARFTVRRTHAAQPYAVDATGLLDGRLLAAHTTGRAATRAASEAAEALRRQVLRIAGAAVARRNEPRVVGNAPPPPSYPVRGVSFKPPEAREEMDLVDHRFLYFGDADDGGRGKVLYLRRDGDYGLVVAA